MVNAYGLEDDGGATVKNQQMINGSVSPNMATPSMSEGGAIPEDDGDMVGDASPNTDVVDYSGAMRAVQQALDYGRGQHGLPQSRPQQANDIQQESAIPDEEESVESYEDGGSIEDYSLPVEFSDDPEEQRRAMQNELRQDLYASNNSQPDSEQYGRPQQVDDPNAVSPPISGNNLNDEDIQRALQASSGDNSGAAPVMMSEPEPDNSGAAPVIAGSSDSGEEPGGIPETDVMGNAVGGSNNKPQSVIGYLQGAGAMTEEQARALEASVAPAAGGDQNAVTALAVQRAGEMDGPASAFSYMQHNRQKYDATLSHARAALTGNEQRPASLDSAIQSATRAFTNIPDATNVRFVQDGFGGVSALVHDVGKKGNERQYNLTPEQFAGITDITKDGQFDRVIAAGGAEGLIRKLTGGPSIGDGPQSGSGGGGRQMGGPDQSYMANKLGNNADGYAQGEKPGSIQTYRGQPTTNITGGWTTMRVTGPDGALQASGSGPIRPWGGTLDRPEVGWDKEATREVGQPNPKQPPGSMNRDVTLLRSEGYRKMQEDQGNRPIIDRRGYTRDYDMRPGTSDFDLPPGRQQNPVTVHSPSGTRQYLNGLDITPDKKQEDKLEQIYAKNEGRGTIEDKRSLKELEYDRRERIEMLRQQGRGAIEDRRDARLTQSLDAKTKMAAERLIEMAKARESREGINDRSSAEKLLAAEMLSGKKPTPERQKVIDEAVSRINAPRTGGGQSPGAALPKPQGTAPQSAAPAASAPVTVQSPGDAQKLPPGTVYMTPDGRKFTR